VNVGEDARENGGLEVVVTMTSKLLGEFRATKRYSDLPREKE
jgi:hypothetical protein